MEYEYHEERGNYTLIDPTQTFYISYQPNPPLGEPHETGICTKDGKYYILIGDWRMQYAEIIDQGLETCMDFYIANKEHRCGWSSDWREF